MLRKTRVGSLVLMLHLLVATGFGQNGDYLPLTKEELGPLFKLTLVGKAPMKGPVEISTSAGVSGATYHDSEGLLFLTGRDKAGKPWRVDLFALGGVCEARLYETDLDQDGVADVVIIRNTGGCGLAPASHVLTVTFDETGRPIPFEAEGYFIERDGGIDALVDLDRDGRADLIFMNYSDGYWITNIYSVSSGRWRRVSGQLAGRKFPLFTRFTYRPNKAPVMPPNNRHPYAPDLANVSANTRGRLVSWSWPDQYTLRLVLEKDDGVQLVATPNYWYDSARLIVDSPSGRKVAHLSYEERSTISPLLDEIISRKLRVDLYGQRDGDHCSPELVWAAER